MIDAPGRQSEARRGLWRLGVAGLAAAYRAGRTDPVEVVAQYRARIAEIDPALNCYVSINPELEREAAQSAARLRDGTERSRLEGVPIALKDNLVARGMQATWGGAVFAGRVRETDELPVARLRAAGAIVLGKTNTPEFAVEGHTHNRLFGTTGNAFDPALTPGGSSGGSASAVAAGLAAGAIGTDGGGSIRRPAGLCGLYGLKPTLGAVPRAGGLPQVLLDFEVVGTLAREVADLRLLHAAMAGPDLADPTSRGRVTGPLRRRSLRILHVARFADHPCDTEILAACVAAAGRLRALGHEVEPGPMPLDLTGIDAVWSAIGEIGLARLRADLPDMAAAASPAYLERADRGDALGATELWRILDLVRALRVEASRFFAGCDLILTPTSAAPAWPAAEPFPRRIDGHAVGPRGHAIYTGWVNAAGLPALSLPAPRPGGAMPVGVQLVGDLAAEAQLLDLAEAYEAQADPWRWPERLDAAGAHRR